MPLEPFTPVLLRNRRADGRPASFDEYRASGGYEALLATIGKRTPEQACRMVLESDLRGRGGAGYPSGRKWMNVPKNHAGSKYVLPNADEMEPGTFKDRILVSSDPHLVIEGTILCAYAVGADKGFFFVRPSYDFDAALIERELDVARQAGFIGKNILGSGFDFEVTVHRSAGRYICGEASAQINAIEGNRPNPRKGVRTTVKGLWQSPTVVNNVETMANVPGILLHGPEWFRNLARNPEGSGSKLYCVSGKVMRPDCYEMPSGTPLREIIFDVAGGLPPGRSFKACLPGGASTQLLPAKFLDLPMDFEPFRKAGQLLGTGSVVVFDDSVCLVGATLNLIEFFARESCGFCTPCREGLPFLREILRLIESGEGREEHIDILKEMAPRLRHGYCAFALGAAQPLLGLLDFFEDELREHISQKQCPLGFIPPVAQGKACGTKLIPFGPVSAPQEASRA